MKAVEKGKYLLQTDSQIFESLLDWLKSHEMMDIEKIHQKLKQKNIMDLNTLMTYLEGPECDPDLSVLAVVLLKRLKTMTHDRLESFTSSTQVGLYLIDRMRGFDQEQLFVLYVDMKNRIIAEKSIFKGTLNKAIVHPRDIFRWAVIYNCKGFFIAHNHPSGDATPSAHDIAFTNKLKQAAEFMEIDFLDHFIVSGEHYLSLRELQLV